jgi:hypothetical protein
VQGQLRHADYINNWLRIEKTPTSDGFGSILVPRSIVGQLGGKLDYTWKPEGFSAFISS